MGIKEQLFADLGLSRKPDDDTPGNGPAEEGLSREADYGLGLEEATAEDIPTRVKLPKPDRPTARTRTRSSAKFELYIGAIKANIEEQLNDAGMVAGEKFGFHTAGMVTITGSEAFSDALVEMARNRPRLLKLLEKTGKGASISKMAKYILAIWLAVMVDLETRDPYTFPMRYLGITDAYEKTHPDGPATTQYREPQFTAPPRFE
jgi:hypothetical protein